MPRSSRHKSHRSHKHSARDARERSESEDDGSSRDRRQRVEEVGGGSGVRVSRDVESDKRKSSSSMLPSYEKDKGVGENGDCSAEHGRKRKERVDGCVTPDRWNVSGKDDSLAEKGSKEEGFRSVGPEKGDKSKILTVESKSRASRRHEGSQERYGESSSRMESSKRRSEKEYSRRDFREDKERDVERVSDNEKDRIRSSERDKRVQDSRHGKSDDVEIRSQSSRRAGVEEERATKKDRTEFLARDDIHSVELEKDSEKFTAKRKKSSGGFEKWQDDGRNIDDKRLSSKDDHKNGGPKVEGHKDERYKDERYKDDRYKDERYKDERYKDERYKDERYKDERYKDDRYRDKNYKDLDRDHRHREIRQRDERSSRDYASDRLENKSARDRDKPIEIYSKKSKLHGSDREVSPRAEDRGIKSKDTRARKTSHDENDDHYGLKHRNAKELRSDVEKDVSNSSKIENRQGKIDSSLSNNLSKSSPSPKTHSSKDYNRRGLKQAEYTNRESASDDRARPLEDHDRISVVHERVSDSLLSEKVKHRDRIKSDDREQRSLENPTTENHFQSDFQHVSVPPSPFKRTGNFPGSSPGHILSQTPMRHGRDSPSFYEEDNRIKSGDRRSGSRYKRNSDPNIERGQGMTWKNGPTWPAPVPNGFIPFQHGPPAPGFHSGIQHFPPPSLFGSRPYMETGIPYHIHEVSDRFTSHGHPFGWHHPADDSCPPQMQGWDDSNSHFGDKSQSYVRPGWDPNRHLVGGRGWELNAEMWKGQKAVINTEFSAPQELADETIGYSSLKPKSEVDQPQNVSGDAAHLKQCNDPPDNRSVEVSAETELRRTFLACRKIENNSRSLSNYLSKLEISADLVHPELYNDIRNILMASNSAAIHNTSMAESAKNNKVRILSKVSNLNSLLPTAANAAFKRAMSVYEKQNYGRRTKPPALASCSNGENASPDATNVNEMKLDSPANTANDVIKNLVPNGNTVESMEEEDIKSSPGDSKISPADLEVELVSSSSDLISDIVLAESPQTCEVVLPECKVNLSRIHNPPESTH